MNDSSQMSSAPGSTLIPDSTTVITTMHLTLIAIFAVLVILGLIWGRHLKRRRNEAERIVAEDNSQLSHPADSDAPDTAAAEPVAATPPTPPPASPAPPPLDAAPVVGTPPEAHSLADEPIAASSTLDASPAVEAVGDIPPPSTDADEAAAANDAIPVTMLKGLGPKVAARLAELGITDARQLAALNGADAQRLDGELGSFSGRMARDRWIEQARLLTAGDKAGYETVFGKL